MPPPIPTLVKPANGRHATDRTPLLPWTEVAYATNVHHQVQESKYPGFSSTVINKTCVTGASHNVTAVLSFDTYYWSVRAVREAGNVSDRTSAWSFTITE